MDVRLERVGDEDAEPRSRGQIGLDLPIGVDQERDAIVGIGDEVARVSEARVEELLDQQLARTLARVTLRSRLLADGLRLLLQDFLTGAEVLLLRRDHRRNAFVDAPAFCFGLFERVLGAWLVFIHAARSGKAHAVRL